MATNNLTVRIRTRYIGWAQFVVGVARVLHYVPLIGAPLARLVFLVCAFQFRAEGTVMATRWRWLRVPFPKVSA